MRILNRTIVIVILTAFGLNAFTNAQKRMDVKLSGEAAELEKKVRRFAPTVMTANTTRLAPNDRVVSIEDTAMQRPELTCEPQET